MNENRAEKKERFTARTHRQKESLKEMSGESNAGLVSGYSVWRALFGRRRKDTSTPVREMIRQSYLLSRERIFSQGKGFSSSIPIIGAVIGTFSMAPEWKRETNGPTARHKISFLFYPGGGSIPFLRDAHPFGRK